MRKRDLWIVFGALAVGLLLGIRIMLGRTVTTGAWGLSFRQEGTAPIGPASAAQLAQYNAAYLGDTGEKVIYLTFDAGYENGCTVKILDILQKHQVPAAFFLVGNYIETNPDLVQRMIREGHIVGNHTMHHYDMQKISEKAAFQKELESLEQAYADTDPEKVVAPMPIPETE